jgi:Immunoglobulin-like domain of bacterial spore germination/Sporulation and spore germination
MTTPPANDSDLRHLLGDAVSDVHPESGPEQIRARARRQSASRWVPLTVAAAVATVVVIGGAAWLAGQQPDNTQAAGPSTPKASPSQQASAGAGAGRTLSVPVYYVGDTASGPRLFAETHRVQHATQPEPQVALQEAMTGAPLDPDYVNPLRDQGVVATLTNEGGAVTIDFSEPLNRPAGMNDERAQMALQSLVWTADAAVNGTGAVTFEVGGSPATEVLGVDTSAPVERASADSVLSTVSISTPSEGARVPTQFEVTGQAATFEANVVWELKQGEKIVRHGFTTATECCTLSPYKFTVNATPGDYTLVVHDTDESDGEGVGTSQDTKTITVE